MSEPSDTTPPAPTSAWGAGLATFDPQGVVLDTWFPAPELGEPPTGATPGTTRLEADAAATHLLAEATGSDAIRGVEVAAVLTWVPDLAAPPADCHDAYLRLHLLSHRLVRPRSISMDGIFGALTNVAWTTLGPVPVDQVGPTRLRAREAGIALGVHGIDKFPRMVDYVTPAGVRIADASRVRLGAHLAEGTTVMHEGFVNFNAGTLGSSMVEGRISQGVVIGEGTDLGGGSSLMGTLSGGGTEVISVGERCLVGANAGIGISLGDDCTIEAGLYVTAGTRVTTPDGNVVKARELSGADGLLFRRNSTTGAVEVLARAGGSVELNTDLHAN